MVMSGYQNNYKRWAIGSLDKCENIPFSGKDPYQKS